MGEKVKVCLSLHEIGETCVHEVAETCEGAKNQCDSLKCLRNQLLNDTRIFGGACIVTVMKPINLKPVTIFTGPSCDRDRLIYGETNSFSFN